jgi:hypothetical protein
MAESVIRVREDEDETPVRNAEAPWREFSSADYWEHNYQEMLPVDREIIQQVSQFFMDAFADREPAGQAIDVGSGANLYPALLMLPWASQILLTDYSEANVSWLRQQVLTDGGGPWTWTPFWTELQDLGGYAQIGEPRKQLREACAGQHQRVGIEQHSVFELPRSRWQLGTMFFVAESITEDPDEFRDAIGGFIGALQPRAPFAAAFMAGSKGYPVAGTQFPALNITEADVKEHFNDLGVGQLEVVPVQTPERVRDGYDGMIVATGIVGGR